MGGNGEDRLRIFAEVPHCVECCERRSVSVGRKRGWSSNGSGRAGVQATRMGVR